MAAIVVTPDLERCLVELVGVFQVAAEDSLVSCLCPQQRPCGGMRIRNIGVADRAFELHAHQLEMTFIERERARGYELADSDLRLHGPFWSYDFNHTLTDDGASAWREAKRPDRNGDEHPELALPFVFERDETVANPYRDYLIVGRFLKQAVLTEVPSGS